MDKTELSGTVERAFRRKGRAYFIVSVPYPNSRDSDTKEKFKIPVTNEIYERYKQEIRYSQQRDSENYVTISGDLEVKVNEYAAF